MQMPHRIHVIWAGLTCLLFFLGMAECQAAEPVLARLSFRGLPPERMGEFAAAYEQHLVPVLNRHGLVASSEVGRSMVDSVFSQAFEFKTVAEFSEVRRALASDSAVEQVLQILDAAVGTSDLVLYFAIHRSPSGPGTRVPSGSGKIVPAGSGTGHWRTYDEMDGLPNGPVRSIQQDRQGHIWFGNSGGASRYDGETFKTFTKQDGLADNDVRSIFQDREGLLWFGTAGGASRYDGKTFKTFTKQDGLADNDVYSIVQDREGVFWFGTRRGGVSRYDGKTFTTFTKQDGLAHNGVASIFQDREGNIWFGAMWGGVSRYDGKIFRTFTTRDGLAGNNVYSIVQDREGSLWLGNSGGASRYDGETFTTFDTQDGLADNRVESIFQDREGNIWFGTRGGGVSRYDPSASLGTGSQTFATFTTRDGLTDNDVHSIFQDREGVLWFGSGSSASRYDGKTFTTFTTDDGLANNKVWSIFQDREGVLWFSTWGGGVSRYDGKTFTNFTTDDGLVHNLVSGMVQDPEGVFWFGTEGGVSRYDGKTFTNFTTKDGLPRRGAFSILQDREGVLWFGAAGGVSRYDGKTFTNFTTEDGLLPDNYWSIFQDREGLLWFGGRFVGVSRYDGKTFTTFTKQDGLAHNAVESIFQDREGNIWFGTASGGVSRYDGKTFTTLTKQDGLANNNVRSIFQDREGTIWLGADGGGVTRYRQPAPSPPPVFIDAVLADRRYEGVSDIAIPSTVALMRFEFHGTSFHTRAETMVYRYRLQGFDEDWQTTRVRRVEYQDLPRGKYTFEVQAVDQDLVYSTAPATVTLTVHLPYERMGLVSALAFAIGLVVYQTGRVVRRDRRLQESNRAMSDANKELFQANQALQRDRAVERIRGEVQAMAQASDFERVLSLLSEDLKAVGLSFDTCGIDVLDEPVNEPSMAYFEERGYSYTAYTIDPKGIVTYESYHIPAPFPPVSQETIARFIAGEPWKALIGGTHAIVEVPASNYGRLRITSSNRQDFKQEDVDSLQDFASAIALGYARYLDIKEIQEQTQRKSAFLASMSHELRTPMNAIKGFTNLVLRRGQELTDRNRENLEKVTQASDHLLAMINDLLDLSKIEAGQMDVNVSTFDVGELVSYCVSTVSPLVQEGVTLSAEVEEGVGEASTDEARLRQMLINLASNAIKFTASGSVTVKARQEDGYLELSVSDTGKGIPDDELATIFDEYRQVKGSDREHKGTGLGLSITKQFSKLLGGSIGVESDVGKGSTFTVRVPVIYKES